jgi:hypothetical protein
MTYFAISTRCSPWGRWGRALRSGLLALFLASASLVPLAGVAAAQDDALPGVHGNLYVSPAFGFVVMAQPESGWEFQSASSDAEGDYIQAGHPSGAVELVSGYQEAGTDAEGCVQGILDALAAAYPEAPLTNWQGEKIVIDTSLPDMAWAQAFAPDPAADDVFASVTCTLNPGDLLLADLLLQPNSAIESGQAPASMLVQAPGRGNTGRPWLDESTPAPGVALFAGRGLPVLTGEASIPFSCLDQETFEVPGDPVPEGMGYFACDGQAANVDDRPVTLDLGGFALGCLPGLPVDPEAGACPEAPVHASHAQVLDTSTGTVDGATVTLEPGQNVDLVLWFTLPEGLPPQDVLYVEGDETFQAGTSYFSAGMGSRPRVRMVR